jgi:hypothetical protein
MEKVRKIFSALNDRHLEALSEWLGHELAQAQAEAIVTITNYHNERYQQKCAETGAIVYTISRLLQTVLEEIAERENAEKEKDMKLLNPSQPDDEVYYGDE